MFLSEFLKQKKKNLPFSRSSLEIENPVPSDFYLKGTEGLLRHYYLLLSVCVTKLHENAEELWEKSTVKSLFVLWTFFIEKKKTFLKYANFTSILPWSLFCCKYLISDSRNFYLSYWSQPVVEDSERESYSGRLSWTNHRMSSATNYSLNTDRWYQMVPGCAAVKKGSDTDYADFIFFFFFQILFF